MNRAEVVAGICFWLACVSFGIGQATPASAQQQAPQVYRMVIQTDPSFGPKCLDVPYASQAVGVRVQMWDCTNGTAQVFTYDQGDRLLKFGKLCVVSWGLGVSGDPVGIDDCGFGPNQRSQVWEVVADGDGYKFTGSNGLCLDIRGGNKERGAPLNLSPCNGTAPQKFVLLEAN